MNRVQIENIYSTIFTPQEYQVELIESCLQKNTVVVLASKSTRAFLITMVTRELSYQTRSKSKGGLDLHTLIIGKCGFKLMRAGEAIQQNTNLAVVTYTAPDQVEGWESSKWNKIFIESQIIVMTTEVLEAGLNLGLIPFELLNLLVITDAHQILSSDLLSKVLSSLGPTCRTLGMTSPVLNRALSPPQLESLLCYIKKNTNCEINTSSEIVSILRYINKPQEKIIMCVSPYATPRPDPETEVRRLMAHTMSFLGDHRYDPVEVYGPEYAEFCIGVPDPVKEPKQILNDFISVLDNLGLWCADRAALYFLVEIEKLKKKTAYDRHYLLLCLIFSVMAQIRAVIEEAFENHSDLQQITNFSTPKVLRLIDILRQVRPRNFVDPRKRRDKTEDEVVKSVAVINKCQKCVCFKKIASNENLDRCNSSSSIYDDVLENGLELETTEPEEIFCGTTDDDNSKLVGEMNSQLEALKVDDDYISCDEVKVQQPSSTCSSPATPSLGNSSSSQNDLTNQQSFCPKMNVDNRNISPDIYSSTNSSAINTGTSQSYLSASDLKPLNDCICSCHLQELTKCKVEEEDETLVIKSISMEDLHSDEDSIVKSSSIDNPVEEDPLLNSSNCAKEEVSSFGSTSKLVNGEIISPPESSILLNGTVSDDEMTESPDKHNVKVNGELESGIKTEVEPQFRQESLASTLVQLMPTGRGKRRREDVKEKIKVHNPEDPDSVCALLFVRHRTTAKIIYRLLKELSDIGGVFGWIFPQYTVELCKKMSDDPRAAEVEHKKQEEVLRRFRHHECNILVSTAVLESGIDIPHCNLVIRFDTAENFTSYVHSRGRAKAQQAFYFHLVVEEEQDKALGELASFSAYESVLLGECQNVETRSNQILTTDELNIYAAPYITPAGITVSLSTAISLLNKYCAKLPSDTFTRLTPMWELESQMISQEQEYQCTIMLPINSPLKGYIKGSWMPNKRMAKMSAALKCCQRLHEINELDDYLLPVGKESMQLEDHLCAPLPDDIVPDGLPRPGTTKRRQYYYKKVSGCLLGSEPTQKVSLFVYKLEMVLTCPIPDDQNTRLRKIYRPEMSSRSFGLITTKQIPQVSGFPVFTRSGEVMVKLVGVRDDISVDSDQLTGLEYFHQFTFTHVLRLEKYPIMFNPDSAHSTFYVAPLTAAADGKDQIDWDFIKLIERQGEPKPVPPTEEERKKFVFEQSLYLDAVVMPWYRNQDQPQYFYVAEICAHLNAQSDFPDAGFESFEKYYLTKYGIQICNLKQPLLDVDHTSGRLNLLTPRHVNRKGVALPTTSEETKRAKRENLQQKQILVPELCTIHPFPASLWRKAVCLPTILYRLNGLLLANELRVAVSQDIGLGFTSLKFEFDWPPLDFGWTLADVLTKSSEAKKAITEKDGEKTEAKKVDSKTKDDSKAEKKSASKASGSELEIGTWSNDMAIDADDALLDDDLDFENDGFDPTIELPDNLTMLDSPCLPDNFEGELGADWGTGLPERKTRIKKKCTTAGEPVRVGSPSNFEENSWDALRPGRPEYQSDDDDIDDEDFYEYDESEQDDEEKRKDEDWEEQNKRSDENLSDEETELDWPEDGLQSSEEHRLKFEEIIEKNKMNILNSEVFVKESDPIIIDKNIKPKPPLATDKKEDDIVSSQVLSTPTMEPIQPLRINRDETLIEVQTAAEAMPPHESDISEELFSFDFQPKLLNHPGPSPSVILQALTMSNANDGVNLERLETIGDSYLKYAITNYLYCSYTQKHEGKLSYLRSKQVSNLNLYRLGKRKRLGECMVATKFEPHDNWLPPGYFVPKELEQALIDSGVPAGHWNMADFPGLHDLGSEEIRRLVEERSEQIKQNNAEQLASELISVSNPQDLPIFIPYNLLTQHSIPDKSIADCVEALIGAYLTTCGPRGALLFMSWLGIKVLPSNINANGEVVLHQLAPPRSPLHTCPLPDAIEQLTLLLSGYEEFEEKINYKFRDKSYLLQAFTHASYHRNRLTDCYQRLEFLGDAVLDYLITRHLFEDKRQHSPGALTDLRSALVNNTIFASLAVKFEFHKYFRHFSPGLDRVVRDFVRMQEENGHKINEEYYFLEEDECESAEDIEVPKALGDVFESIAGAIFLDSGGSLDAVWRVYFFMMKSEIEQFSGVVPKSPIRELLEMEPETAKFGKPERLVDGKVRVSVEVFGKGSFSGVGRNYRIAKSTAAKRALRNLKKLSMTANDDTNSFA